MSHSGRFHALDAARGFALLLGIALHATMSFFLPIPAQDTSQGTAPAIAFYVIHTFRMSLFFLLAGFFAHLLLERRGTRGFVKDRARRILVPMTAGWLVLAPLTIGIVIVGLARTFPHGAPDGAAPGPQGFPLTHLWFLYYLSMFYAIALALRAGFVRWLDRDATFVRRIDAAIAALVASRLAPLVLAAPTFAVLVLDADWPVWFGIPTPDTGLAPKLPALVAFGTAFAFGWMLHRRRESLAAIERHAFANLALGVGLTTLCLAIVGPVPDLAAPTVVEAGATARTLHAGSYALSIWCWTFGLVGAALRFCANESRVRRYLADASYWFYLAHLPIVFALQVALMKVPLHWSVKLPLIIAITVAILFASYEYLVRRTWLGELLNGRRLSPFPAPRCSPSPAPQGRAGEGYTPVAELTHATRRYAATAALDDVSIAIHPAELVAILGPNGAGKTTAIGLWLGTLQPTEGIARVMGGSPLDVHSRLATGAMLQETNLAPELDAREQIALASSYYRDPLGIDETIALAGIEAFATKRYAKLSAGQKRQVQFAVAICGRPRLLFLDEPTVGLDIDAREAMWRNIRRLRDEGCAIVLTTHYLEEAEALADRVVVLAKGRVVAEGSVDAMRSLVARKRVSCASAVEIDDIRRWNGVVEAVRHDRFVHVTASDAESVVRRLLAADAALTHLEVKQATLADAFTELTREAA